MSKMEEKLKASIKTKQPAREKPQPDTTPPAKGVAGEGDLNVPDTALHPQRIWPD